MSCPDSSPGCTRHPQGCNVTPKRLFSPYYQGGKCISPRAGGTMCKPQSTTAPEVGSRRPKGHEQSALRIVAPGRARVARRRPSAAAAPRPRPAPLPGPLPSVPWPGPRPPGPLPSVPLPGQRIRHHWPRSAWRPINSLRESKGTGGVQSLIDQDQEQPEYSDLPPCRGAAEGSEGS